MTIVRSKKTLKIRPYTIENPVKEVYGTIVYERFEGELGEDFLGHHKRLGVSEICAFRDAKCGASR